MPGRFQFEKLPKYPHMKPEDVAVWERFIEANPDFFETVDYDVHVGEGRELPPNLPENIARSGKKLTQRKIDVVGYIDSATYLVEIKPTADTRALGQIEMYFDLYMQATPTATDVFKMILAADIEPDLMQTYRSHEVLLELV